jgi:hypothetical protein
METDGTERTTEIALRRQRASDVSHSDDCRCGRTIPLDGMDATHYPTRDVSDTGWKHRYWMDATLDPTAGEGARTDSADSPATAS